MTSGRDDAKKRRGRGKADPSRAEEELGWLAEHATSKDVLDAYRGRSVEPLMPEFIGQGEETKVVLPGIADSSRMRNLAEEIQLRDLAEKHRQRD